MPINYQEKRQQLDTVLTENVRSVLHNIRGECVQPTDNANGEARTKQYNEMLKTLEAKLKQIQQQADTAAHEAFALKPGTSTGLSVKQHLDELSKHEAEALKEFQLNVEKEIKEKASKESQNVENLSLIHI